MGTVTPLVLSSLPSGGRLARRGIVVFDRSAAPGWFGLKTLWFAEKGYQGPVLIRGRQLDGGGPVAFGEQPAELARMIPPSEVPSANILGGYRTWPGSTFVKHPGCYEFRIDGQGFSDSLVFEARVGSPS